MKLGCPTCHALNEPGTRFCGNCGAALTGQLVSASPETQRKPAGEYARQGFYGGCGCLGLVLLIVLAPIWISLLVGGGAVATAAILRYWWLVVILALIAGAAWWLMRRRRERDEQAARSMRCPACGTLNYPTATFCAKCAALLNRRE